MHSLGSGSEQEYRLFHARARVRPRPPDRLPPRSAPVKLPTTRAPSSSSTRTTTRGSSSGWVGWCETIQLRTVPRPDACRASHSSDPHRGHMGDGGCCTRPQCRQVAKSTTPRWRPDQKNRPVSSTLSWSSSVMRHPPSRTRCGSLGEPQIATVAMWFDGRAAGLRDLRSWLAGATRALAHGVAAKSV